MLPGTRRDALWCLPSCRTSASRALSRSHLGGERAAEWFRVLEARGWLRRDAIVAARALAAWCELEPDDPRAFASSAYHQASRGVLPPPAFCQVDSPADNVRRVRKSGAPTSEGVQSA